MTGAAGPRWTRRRLLDALAACYGAGDYQGIDLDAVAAGFGVTRRTVTRWIAGSSGRTKARMPAKRIAELMLPPQSVIRDEQIDVANAREVIASLNPANPAALGRRPTSIAKEWQRRGWLDPHLVGILELPRQGRLQLRQIVSTWGTYTQGPPRTTREWRRRGHIVDLVTVPTRFHAMVLVAEVLDRVGPWRLYPSEAVVPKTRTQVWAADAPAVNLAALAQETGLALRP
ncbi:hypothetical protein [Nocardia transvalensis]|uniref:hypothetical protein n=1 Tax=Nocardia transvalensis TaxID=37333 RepID=UPI0018938047|nr:hypothetical protein [Nocardia transvalensis]MBF6333647.1 hypothetical protein [Nocardia transvalensis]